MANKMLGKVVAGAALGGASLAGVRAGDRVRGRPPRRRGKVYAKPHVVKAGEEVKLLEICPDRQEHAFVWSKVTGKVKLKPAHEDRGEDRSGARRRTPRDHDKGKDEQRQGPRGKDENGKDEHGKDDKGKDRQGQGRRRQGRARQGRDGKGDDGKDKPQGRGRRAAARVAALPPTPTATRAARTGRARSTARTPRTAATRRTGTPRTRTRRTDEPRTSTARKTAGARAGTTRTSTAPSTARTRAGRTRTSTAPSTARTRAGSKDEHGSEYGSDRVADQGRAGYGRYGKDEHGYGCGTATGLGSQGRARLGRVRHRTRAGVQGRERLGDLRLGRARPDERGGYGEDEGRSDERTGTRSATSSTTARPRSTRTPSRAATSSRAPAARASWSCCRTAGSTAVTVASAPAPTGVWPPAGRACSARPRWAASC